HDGERTVVGGSGDDGLGDARGALGEGFHFKYAHGSIPEHGLGVSENLREFLDRLWSDIQRHPAFWNAVELHVLVVRIRSKLRRRDEIYGQYQLVAETLQQGLAVVDLVFLQQGLLHVVALRRQHRVAHAAADDDLVCLISQRFNHTQLVGYLRAAENNYVWVCRFRCNGREHVELR